MNIVVQSILIGLHEQFFVPSQVTGLARRRLIREKAVEAIGSVLGMGGAVWFALRITGFSYAYIPFVLSSISLTCHFYQKRQGWLMLQQAAYTVINLAGIYCWILT